MGGLGVNLWAALVRAFATAMTLAMPWNSDEWERLREEWSGPM